MRTWGITLKNGRTLKVKTLKAEAEKLERVVSRLLDIRFYHKEMSGIIGEDEYEFDVLRIGGSPSQLRDELGYKDDIETFFRSLPEVVTDIAPVVEEARRIFGKYIKVIDNRKTREDDQQEKLKMAEITREIEAKREAEAKLFRDQYCKPAPVAIPEGMMAVYLEITFDDSDPMSDYFAPHRQIGEDMLFAIVCRQPEAERLARSVLSRYPELAKLSWEWRTEKYSMGHGNYLISEWAGTAKQKAYDGREEVRTRYEIRFNKHAKSMYPYKDYAYRERAFESNDSEVNGNASAVMTLNDEKKGVELKFNSKPNAEVLATLKANGFRWSKFQKIWYAKQSPGTMEVARQIAA